MSVELYKSNLARRRQEILIDRMRSAIDELADIADSVAISSVAYIDYIDISRRIEELRVVGSLTPADIGKEFGSNPPGFDPDGEGS